MLPIVMFSILADPVPAGLYNSVTVLALLLSRASVNTFGEPAPADADLQLIFEAAVRAPDHGKLRPWRFLLIRGAARTALSELYVAALQRRDPEATEAQVEKERAKPLRAPLVIAIVARLVTGHKVPEIEQTLSAGAAVMNMLNAIHALGFGAKWVTGPNCYDPQFRADLGLDPTDQLIGFLHVGTALENLPPPERPDPAAFVTEWTGK